MRKKEEDVFYYTYFFDVFKVAIIRRNGYNGY
jgi:hypothetical protein